MLQTILKLKRTLSPSFPGPMAWREIAKRVNMSSGQLAHYHAKRLLGKSWQTRCPCCLRPLSKEKE